MGLRETGPRPQPQDLRPVGLSEAQTELAEQEATLASEPRFQAPTVESGEREPAGQDELAEAFGVSPTASEAEDLLAQEFGIQDEEFTPGISDVERGEGAGVLIRAIGGIGRTRDEQLKLMQKFGGGKFQFRINPSSQDRIEFKRPEEGKWRAIDPDHFEFFGDLADISGIAGEAAIEIPAEIAGAGLGAAVGGMGGTVAGAVVGAAAGAAAGGAAGGAASALAREGAVRLLGIEPTAELGTEMFYNASLASAGALVSTVAPKLLNAGYDKFFRKRITRTDKDQLEFLDDVFTQLKEETGYVPRTPRQFTEEVGAFLDNKERSLNALISEVEEPAFILAGDKRFVPERMLASMQVNLSREGVQFIQEETSKGSGRRFTKAILPKGSEKLSIFGVEGGATEAQKMLDIFNAFSRESVDMGGSSLATIRNSSRSLNEASRFNEASPKHPKVRAFYKMFAEANRVDQRQVMSDLFHNAGRDDLVSLVDDAYETFSGQIGAVRNFVDELNRRKARGELDDFADALVRPGASDRLIEFRDLVDPDSRMWADVRGAWLGRRIDKARSFPKGAPEIGVVSPKKLMNDLDSYGEDVLRIMLPKQDRVRVQTLLRAMEQIKPEEVFKQFEVGTLIRDVMIGFGKATPFRLARINAVMRLLGNSPEFLKWLRDKGLVEAMNDAKDSGTRQTIGFIRRAASSMLAATPIALSKTGQKLLQEEARRDREAALLRGIPAPRGMREEEFMQLDSTLGQ